jgi:hypothetical protein
MPLIACGSVQMCRNQAVFVLDVVFELFAEMLQNARTGIAAASPSAQMVRP